MPAIEADKLVDELLHTAEGQRNPYPLYHRLREIAPVYRAPWGTWFLTRYADCAAALRDPRLGKNYQRQSELRFGPDWRRHPSLENGERSMVNLDGAAHTRLRRLVVKAFTPRTVDALRPKIEESVDRLLDPLAEREGGDIFEELAFPLSVNVIGELLGVPEADRPQFRTIARDTTLVFEARPTPEQLEAADRAQLASRAYFSSLIEEKRRRPVAAPRSVCPHARAASSAAESFQHTLAKDARL